MVRVTHTRLRLAILLAVALLVGGGCSRDSRPDPAESSSRSASPSADAGAAGQFADSLARIRRARSAGIKRPILLGGSVTEGNVAEALTICDGVIVSTALMRKDAAADDLLRWDIDLARRFMDAARA